MLASTQGIIYNPLFKRIMKLKRSFGQVIAGLFFLCSLAAVWLISPSGILEKVNWVGSSVCHQLPLHSFHLDGKQFPLCSRCTGTYLSAFISLIFFGLKGKRYAIPRKSILVLFLAFFLFWTVDGINSFANDVLHQSLFYEPSNLIRFFSGIGMGMVFSLVILTIFNMVIWQDRDARALVHTWKDMAVLLLLESVLFFFPWNKSLLVFNIAGIISTFTVLILIGLLYTILIIILFRREGCYQNWRDLFVPLAFGFGIALLQVILLVNLRMKLVGFTIFPL